MRPCLGKWVPGARVSRLLPVGLLVLLWGLCGWTTAVLADDTVHLPAQPTATSLTLPNRVDELEIHGTKRTHRSVIEREFGVRPGQVVREDQWAVGIARLWNTNLFSNVHGRVEARGSRNVAVLDLDERWTLNPLVGFSNGGGSTEFKIGVGDFNTFGRFLEFDAIYERFNEYNGFSLQLKNPRLLDQRIELAGAVERLMRPRPRFVDRRLHLRLESNTLLLSDRLRLGGSVDVFQADFLPPGANPHEPAPMPTARGMFADAGMRVGRMDLLRNRQRGFTLEVRPGVGATRGDQPVWGQLWLESMAFWAPGERWNLATRVQSAVMTEAPVFVHWYLGGLQQIRGFQDNHFRTRDYVLANVELRMVAWDSTWLALMPTVFVDAVAVHDDVRGRIAGLALGGGVRFLVPEFVRTGLRVDVALPIGAQGCTSASCLGFSLGVYQFFF